MNVFSQNVTDRFWPKVNKDAAGDCWEWTAAKSDGYGDFSVEGRVRKAHRVAYEMFIGPIPDGRCIDHLCRNRACVNPKHLEAVSVRLNVLRGVGGPAQNARKTHCKRGHEFTTENTHIGPKGRRCRACHRLEMSIRRAAVAAKRPPLFVKGDSE